MRASDVVASLQRLKKSEIAHVISNVKSVSAETGALVLELYAADENLASRLSSIHTAVTPKGRAPNWRRLVGSGPFQFKTRSTRTNELQLIAYPRYFAGRAYADEIHLRWFEDKSTETRNYETGAAHISMRGQIAFAGHRPKFKTEKRDFEAMLLVYVGFGKSNPLLGEESFRQALAAAIGRAGMTQIGSGEQVVPTLSPLPRSARGTVISSAGMAANLTRATALLKELGEKYRALNSSSLLLDIIVNKSRPDDAIVAGRVAAALFALGIQTRLVVLQADAFASRIASGKCELYIGQLATPAEFPTDTLRTAYVAGGFQALLGAVAKKGRAGLERQFAAQLPVVPLFHRGLRVHHRSDLLSVGFDGSARLRYEDMYFYGTPQKN
jgi:ABC-type transport system substrate-binding protein